MSNRVRGSLCDKQVLALPLSSGVIRETPSLLNRMCHWSLGQGPTFCKSPFEKEIKCEADSQMKERIAENTLSKSTSVMGFTGTREFF